MLFLVRTPGSKNHAVYPALKPHRFNMGETHPHKAPGLPPNCRVPSVSSGLDTSWPAIPEHSDGRWHPTAILKKNISRCARSSAQNPFRDSLFPSHMLSTSAMFVFLYHFRDILTVSIILPFAPSTRAFH